MLKVDLARLAANRRVSIDVAVPADDPAWTGTELALAAPVEVRLVAERTGSDAVVRGSIAGAVKGACRRCLKPVRLRFDEPVTFLYRSGMDPAEAVVQEAYPVPARAREIDLAEALREHVLLAVPAYVLCTPDCRGLGPICGVDRNAAECACEAPKGDDRWAALRGIRLE
jgi:uncharacterized protein